MNSASSGAGMVADAFGNAKSNMSGSVASNNSVSGGYFKQDGGNKTNSYAG